VKGSGAEVTPEPSLLQAEQPQLTHPVLIGEVFQPSDHLRGPSLDPLQHIHVLLMLGAPELDAVLQVGCDLIAAFQYLKGAYRKDGEGLFTRVCSDRIRGTALN